MPPRAPVPFGERPKLHEHQGSDLFLVLLIAAIGVALNPAAAFAVGLPIAYAFKREWLRV